MRRFLFFALAGAAGFVADAAALSLLLRFTPLGVFAARVVSIALAMALTWSLNRAVTFGPSGRGLVAEGTRYGGVSLLASGVNYLAYSAVLLARPGTWPVLAVAIGSGVAMTVSFLGYSRFVFNR